VHASTRLPGWVVPKSSVELEAFLDSLAMPSCLRCGAITDGVDSVCYPCRSGNRTAPPYGSRKSSNQLSGASVAYSRRTEPSVK
jgi:hypothetical protein